MYPIEDYPLDCSRFEAIRAALRRKCNISGAEYHDILRHTAITMEYALTGSIAKAATFARDREETIKLHYLNTNATFEEAQKFHTKILPTTTDEKIVKFR